MKLNFILVEASNCINISNSNNDSLDFISIDQWRRATVTWSSAKDEWLLQLPIFFLYPVT